MRVRFFATLKMTIYKMCFLKSGHEDKEYLAIAILLIIFLCSVTRKNSNFPIIFICRVTNEQQKKGKKETSKDRLEPLLVDLMIL